MPDNRKNVDVQIQNKTDVLVGYADVIQPTDVALYGGEKKLASTLCV